jgi:hypothetical protein
MKNEKDRKIDTEKEKTIKYLSRGFMIRAIFQYRNNSLNDYIAFFRAYLVTITLLETTFLFNEASPLFLNN